MANFITIFRVILAFYAASLLFKNDPNSYIWALILTVIVFILDGVDGYVARKFNETSKFGSVLDIMGDRVVDNTYWVVFAVLGWLPVSIPIIILTRSFVVDGFRSVALEKGHTAFGEMSMQDDKFGYFICCSKFSRITYAVAKALAFVLLIFAYTQPYCSDTFILFYILGSITTIIAVEFCVIRALPVIFASKKFFNEKPDEKI